MEKREFEGSGTDRDPSHRAGADRAAEPSTEVRRTPAARPLSLGTAQRIQASAGNRALARIMAQRRAPAPVPETAPAPASENEAAAPDESLPVQRLARPPGGVDAQVQHSQVRCSR
ncbi:hypothetical protein Acsp02_74450 [Actinoplanes sp. NBRC 103695]|nr:hypothetical protein Acsp02_74450 [Actinoplanes sp. NBRC 103695]